MKTLLIHIGRPKTGTTSIQRALYKTKHIQFSEGNCKINYDLPIEDHIHSQHLIWLYFRDSENMPRWLKYEINRIGKEKVSNNIAEWLLRMGNYENAIILSEYISSWTVSELESFKKTLNNLGFSKIHILSYFRKPDDFYLSFLQQHIKASSTIISPYTFRTNYKIIIEKFKNIFGEVECRNFSKEELMGSDIIIDFLSVVERVFNTKINKPIFKVKVANESLSSESMAALVKLRNQHLNGQDNVINNTGKKIVELLNESKSIIYGQQKASLNAKLKETILRNNNADIEFLIDYSVNFKRVEISNNISTDDEIKQIDQIDQILESCNVDIVNKIQDYVNKKLEV